MAMASAAEAECVGSSPGQAAPKAAPGAGVSWLRALFLGIAFVSTVVAGCTAYRPYIPESEGHIEKPKAKPQADAAIPPPARVSTFVPPPLRT